MSLAEIADVSKYENYDGKKAVYVDTAMITTAFTEEYTSAQTGTAIITPPEGYKVCVRSISTSGNGNTGIISLDFSTSGKKVHRHYMATLGRASESVGHILGAVNEPLSLTTTTSTDNVFIIVVYTFHK